MAPVVRHQPGPPAGHQDNIIYSVPPSLGPNRQNWLVVMMMIYNVMYFVI